MRNDVVEVSPSHGFAPASGALRAEVKGLLRRGGCRRALAVSVGLAFALGLSALALVNVASGGRQLDVGTEPGVTVPVEVTSATAAILLSIGMVMHGGRSVGEGAVAIALSVAPDRARLYRTRLVAVALVAATATAGVVTVIAALALISAGRTAGLTPAAVGLVCGALAAAAVASLAYAVGMMLGRATSGLLVVLGWWLILPLALLAVQGVLPRPVAAVSEVLGSTSPIALVGRATTVSTLASRGVLDTLLGHLGLGAWLAALVPFCYVVFRRRSF